MMILMAMNEKVECMLGKGTEGRRMTSVLRARMLTIGKEEKSSLKTRFF